MFIVYSTVASIGDDGKCGSGHGGLVWYRMVEVALLKEISLSVETKLTTELLAFKERNQNTQEVKQVHFNLLCVSVFERKNKHLLTSFKHHT